MPANFVLLERIELNASAASVTFANIPQTGYTDLKIVFSTRDDNAQPQNGLFVSINGSTANFTNKYLLGSGSAASSGSIARFLGYSSGAGATANTFSNGELYFPNYTSSDNKSFSSDNVQETNASTAYMVMSAHLWSQTAAITSISLIADSASFVQYSTFSLYGLAALGTTPTIAPKASGGNKIDYDGTYWIHTFNTNGTFTPQTGLTCDYLVVAGGGGGSATRGGGGGAGGYRTGTSLSISTATTVTVGAGGANSSWASDVNTNGADSTFSTITSTGGGKGGYSDVNGSSGGSGGGSGNGNAAKTGGTGNTPSTSPAQGTNGGFNGSDFLSNTGGGGGAGAAGGNGTSGSGNATGGAGGNGTASSISGTSVTYAGGGGGCANGTGTVVGGSGGTGGGGAGGIKTTVSGPAGTVNTGGGGGGAYDSPTTSGAGGSGIVIIRYLAA